MPKYRIHVKLEGKPLKEYVVYSAVNDIEHIYHDYRNRVKSKNGAGRVEYFDLVMIAETSLKYKADREEVFNPENNFGLSLEPGTKRNRDKRVFDPGRTLGERVK